MKYILSDDKNIWKSFISSLDEKNFDIYHTYEFNNIYNNNMYSTDEYEATSETFLRNALDELDALAGTNVSS